MNLLDVKSGYVDLWKVPISIIDDLERFEAKDDGDITRRQYTVIQFQSEGKTRYSVDREERDTTPVSEYKDKMKDHQQALSESYIEVWGEDPSDEESPIQEPSARKKPKKTEEEKPPFDDDSSEEEEEEIAEEDLYKMDADELKNLFRSSGLQVPRTTDAKVLAAKLIEELGNCCLLYTSPSPRD